MNSKRASSAEPATAIGLHRKNRHEDQQRYRPHMPEVELHQGCVCGRPVPYSPLSAITARIAATAWPRSIPVRLILAGSSAQPLDGHRTAAAAARPPRSATGPSSQRPRGTAPAHENASGGRQPRAEFGLLGADTLLLRDATREQRWQGICRSRPTRQRHYESSGTCGAARRQ